jgi:hypothetical protein
MISAELEQIARTTTFGTTDENEHRGMTTDERQRMLHTLLFDLTHLMLTMGDRLQQIEDEVHFATPAAAGTAVSLG